MSGPGRNYYASRPTGQLRWVICFLLFLATGLNYIDRQVIALLKVTLAKQFDWTQSDYANIVFAFQAAYAAGLIVAGRFIDRVGVRAGYCAAVLLWSMAAAAHGLVALIPRDAHLYLHRAGLFFDLSIFSVMAFSLARMALGFAEAANFPAAIKATSEWFPQKERALATGLFNAGSNVGALTAPYLVPLITLALGWPMAFVITGGLGMLWIILWLIFYHAPQKHPRLSPAERQYILADGGREVNQSIPWRDLFFRRQTLAFSLAKFLTDPFWWFYLFWIPGFLEERHGVKLMDVFLPLVTIYGASSVGSVAGGYLSSALIKRGRSVNFSRKIAMLACALCVTPIFLAAHVHSLWLAVALIALAAAAHQGFSCNLFTLVSDTVPKRGISTVVGIGGMAGAIGGMLMAKFVGYILDLTRNNYAIPFALPSVAYLGALLVLHLLLPRLQELRLKDEAPDQPLAAG